MPDIFVEKKSHELNEQQHPLHAARESVSNLLHHKAKTMGSFAAYCIRPQGVSFVNQEQDETILLFLRRHFITNVPWLLSSLLLLSVPLILFALSMITSIFATLPAGLVLVVTAFYYLIVLGYAFGNFISWFYNIGIVTQKRIMDLDSSNILSHETATATLNEIVDVTFTQKGFFQSFFNYGDVHIQTEAIHANFEFIAASNPTQVEDIISDLRVAMRGEPHGNS